MKSPVQFESMACYVCGERLTDPESVNRGTGPVCAGKLSSFLAAAGSSAEEIASLALIDDATVSRMLRIVGRSLNAGRVKDAQLFLQSARRAAKVAQAEAVKEAA